MGRVMHNKVAWCRAAEAVYMSLIIYFWGLRVDLIWVDGDRLSPTIHFAGSKLYWTLQTAPQRNIPRKVRADDDHALARRTQRT